jgi:hypothetical protein
MVSQILYSVHNPYCDFAIALRTAPTVPSGVLGCHADGARPMAVIVIFPFLRKEFQGAQELGTVWIRDGSHDGFIREIGIE